MRSLTSSVSKRNGTMGTRLASRHGAIPLNAHRKEQAPTKFIGWLMTTNTILIGGTKTDIAATAV